jgi:hypothetical protein
VGWESGVGERLAVQRRGHTCKPTPPTCNRSFARVHVVLRSAASVSSARRACNAPKRGGEGAVTCTCACASRASEEAAADATTAGVAGGAIGCTGGGGHARTTAGRLFSCCLPEALERLDFALAGLAFARFRRAEACKRFVALDEAPPEARRAEIVQRGVRNRARAWAAGMLRRSGSGRVGSGRVGSGRGGQGAGRSAPAAAKLVLGLSSALSALSSGLESSGNMSSGSSPLPELEEKSEMWCGVSVDSSEVASDDAMEVSACDGRALPTHVGALTRCRSERSSSPVKSVAVGCAIAAGIAANCEEPTATGLAVSALPPWPRLRFRLAGVLTSEPVLVLVPPRAAGDTSPPVSDCDCCGSGGATAAGGSTSKRPVADPFGGAEADEAAEEEAADGFFFFSFPCLDAARAHVESCGGCGGCGGGTAWRLGWWASSTSRCLCDEEVTKG